MPSPSTDFDLRAHTVLLTVGGSRVYGLASPDSDVDLKGVAIPPARYFHGLLHSFEQADQPGDMDVFSGDLAPGEQQAAQVLGLEGTVYELRKFLRLASESNPNILDLLFCRDQDVRLQTSAGRQLRAQRDLFVSRRARHAYAGYAKSQLSRIRLHWQWIHHGLERQPSRADFGLPESSLLPGDQLGALQAAISKKLDSWGVDWSVLPPPERIALQERLPAMLAELELASDDARWTAAARIMGVDDNLMEIARRERGFASAQGEWKRYQRWKRERNPERAALEAQHGYDTKHAAHLVRLLRMGVEIMTEGRVHVWRGDRDADELRAIRSGAWSYERLLAWVEDQEGRLAELDRTGGADLPARPDMGAVDALCVELVERALEQRLEAP